jgi:hypothetical protein
VGGDVITSPVDGNHVCHLTERDPAWLIAEFDVADCLGAYGRIEEMHRLLARLRSTIAFRRVNPIP